MPTFTPYSSDPPPGPNRREGEAERATLIRKFNRAIGAPNAEVQHMQDQFTRGEMTADEAVSFERYCRYMLSIAGTI